MMHDIIKMCSFESTKSTKGASKMRRDLLNAEISQLRDLLPLPPSTRQRLSQLQLMALVCVYVRKSNYFQQAMKNMNLNGAGESPNLEFLKALSGFLMMLTQGGKLLYISDNAAEYLGHSMEDLLIHGDSVFDIIDKQDHAAVQSELVRGAQTTIPTEEERLFLCRMNVSRNARRQMRFGDQKVVLVQGHYLSYLPLCSRNEPVFLAHCTPVAMPETRECVVQGATNVFTSVHTLDMKFISIDTNGEFYLGYEPSSLVGVSWYHLVHPDSMREVQTKHRLITSSEQDRSCILLLRLQSASGSWRWVHCVLQVKDSGDASQQTTTATTTTTTTTPAPSTSTALPQQQQQQQQQTASQQQQQQQPVIVATNQVLSEKEASVLRANAWLYHYYAMQSKLQYGIAYDAHAQRVHAYYPQVMPYQDNNGHYMATPSMNNGSIHAHPISHSTTSAYSLAAGSPYLQHYHHPYAVRLHHGFDSSWGYYDSTANNDHSPTYSQHHHHQQNQQQHQHQQQQQQQQQQQHHHQSHHHSQQISYSASSSPQRSSRKSSPPKSPRRSPPTPSAPQNANDTSGGVAVIAPVAVRLSSSLTSNLKNISSDLEDLETNSWKSSPSQEVPEYYEYPFVTPPYSSTPTKSVSFNFEPTEPKDAMLKDQRVVPNIEVNEGRWSNDTSIRSPWLPPEEITGPLRVLNHIL